ncbi:MAG TPA: LysM domain-containing protein [Thermoleophilaceae bacterium]|nr:LysM domain-containing protein [Thermoleophilaceae bacterium]
MPDDARSSPARLLAPLALVLFTIAFLGIVFTSGTGDEDGDRQPRAGRQASGQRERTTTTPRPQRTFYTVKVGDTLGGIAETTGVPVETLLELNPELDPQALVSGQRIRLRE